MSRSVLAALSVPAAAASTGPTSAQVVFSAVIAIAGILEALWLLLLVEVLSWPRTTWDAAGESKARWVMRILFLGWLGAGLYAFSARRHLRKAHAAAR